VSRAVISWIGGTKTIEGAKLGDTRVREEYPTANLCWCCWFDRALLLTNDESYFGSRSRRRRRAVCSGIRVYGTPSLGDEYADYIRSHDFMTEVMRERLRKMFGID